MTIHFFKVLQVLFPQDYIFLTISPIQIKNTNFQNVFSYLQCYTINKSYHLNKLKMLRIMQIKKIIKITFFIKM